MISLFLEIGDNITGGVNMDAIRKQELIKQYGRHEGDTGSPEVQIARCETLVRNRISEGLTALQLSCNDN